MSDEMHTAYNPLGGMMEGLLRVIGPGGDGGIGRPVTYQFGWDAARFREPRKPRNPKRAKQKAQRIARRKNRK